MHPYDSIRWRALRDVWFYRSEKNADPEYFLRKVFRWYSKTFATPLHMVEDLVVEDVLIAYYEQMFEDMTDEEIENHIKEVIVTDEQRAEEARQAVQGDAWDDELVREAQAENAAKAAKAMEAALKPATDALQKMLAIAKGAGKEASLVPNKPMTPMPLPGDGIKMTFIPDEEMEELMNSDPFTLFPGKKISPT